jgi:hypothetical protein
MSRRRPCDPARRCSSFEKLELERDRLFDDHALYRESNGTTARRQYALHRSPWGVREWAAQNKAPAAEL